MRELAEEEKKKKREELQKEKEKKQQVISGPNSGYWKPCELTTLFKTAFIISNIKLFIAIVYINVVMKK